MTDWNGDGRKDLLIGCQIASKIALLLNSGTDAQPVFADVSYLKADEQDIIHPACNCGSPAPWACDFDGDGKRDLLVGAGSDGTVWFYRNTTDTGVYWCRNTNSNSAIMLQTALAIRTPVAGIGLVPIVTASVPGARMRVFPVDWNSDGVMDLLLGNADGSIFYYEGYRFAFTRVASHSVRQAMLQWKSRMTSPPFYRSSKIRQGGGLIIGSPAHFRGISLLCKAFIKRYAPLREPKMLLADKPVRAGTRSKMLLNLPVKEYYRKKGQPRTA